jgi:hypothetical protein
MATNDSSVLLAADPVHALHGVGCHAKFPTASFKSTKPAGKTLRQGAKSQRRRSTQNATVANMGF